MAIIVNTYYVTFSIYWKIIVAYPETDVIINYINSLQIRMIFLICLTAVNKINKKLLSFIRTLRFYYRLSINYIN